MKITFDEFNGVCVVIPRYKMGPYGYLIIDKGTMTDIEWKTWKYLTEIKEIKQFIQQYIQSKNDISKLSDNIISILVNKGLEARLTTVI
jgi:hypothetical protein